MPESAMTTSHSAETIARAVESVLKESPAVADCCTKVMRRPQHLPELTALVVPADFRHPPEANSLRVLCRNALASEFGRLSFRVVPALPREASGGLLRTLIHIGSHTDQACDGTGPDPYAYLGTGYSGYRKPDPRIAQMIETALGSALTVVNVGAGTGSYEPATRLTIAVEPSMVMIGQRPLDSYPAVQAFAELLPFVTNSFDAALATMTVHLWSDAEAGLAEMRRVSGKQVILTWDQVQMSKFWLVADYLPDIALHEADLAGAQRISELLTGMGASVSSVPVPVPADCVDGFLAAYWNRPEAYLDPEIRHSISIFDKVDPQRLDEAMARLQADLVSGAWRRRYSHLLDRNSSDVGYRLICAQ